MKGHRRTRENLCHISGCLTAWAVVSEMPTSYKMLKIHNI